MLKLDKGIRPPTRGTYIQYFEELKSKEFTIDDYDDNTPLAELEKMQKHIIHLLYSEWFISDKDSKDLRMNKVTGT